MISNLGSFNIGFSTDIPDDKSNLSSDNSEYFPLLKLLELY